MAHFAKLEENGRVIAVLTLNDSDLLNASGVEDESVGQQYLEKHNNWPSHMWIKTSYNTRNNQHNKGGTPFRGNYAGIGYIWDKDNQIFWPPSPYASWVKDITTAFWKSPVGNAPLLTEEQTAQNYIGTHFWDYVWNETTKNWDFTNHHA